MLRGIAALPSETDFSGLLWRALLALSPLATEYVTASATIRKAHFCRRPLDDHRSKALTATVKNGGAPVTSGTVTFSEGSNTLGSASLNSSGVAQLPIATSGLAAGTYTVHAAFGGSGSSIPAASGTVSLVVQ